MVADRRTVSRYVMDELQHTHEGTTFILGARMRAVKEVRDEVLSRPGRYQVVHGPRNNHHGEPAPLKVKEVRVGQRRYIVCPWPRAGITRSRRKKTKPTGRHVFCSFLALMLLKDLQTRMEVRGWRLHWDRLRHDLDALEQVTVRNAGKAFVIRTRTLGDAGKAIQAVGVTLGPTLRLLSDKDSG